MSDEAKLYPVYFKLVDLLKHNNARFREVSHQIEGKSEKVAALRGSTLQQGAKAMVLKVGKKYVLAVLSSSLRVDMQKVASAMNEKKASFASMEDAEKLSGCKMGAVPPFCFNNDLILIVDSSILKVPEIAFNAARLDRSIFLNTEDYIRITKPIVTEIAQSN